MGTMYDRPQSWVVLLSFCRQKSKCISFSSNSSFTALAETAACEFRQKGWCFVLASFDESRRNSLVPGMRAGMSHAHILLAEKPVQYQQGHYEEQCLFGSRGFRWRNSMNCERKKSLVCFGFGIRYPRGGMDSEKCSVTQDVENGRRDIWCLVEA